MLLELLIILAAIIFAIPPFVWIYGRMEKLRPWTRFIHANIAVIYVLISSTIGPAIFDLTLYGIHGARPDATSWMFGLGSIIIMQIIFVGGIILNEYRIGLNLGPLRPVQSSLWYACGICLYYFPIIIHIPPIEAGFKTLLDG